MNWIGTHRVSKGGTLVQRVRNSFLFYHSPWRLISSSSFSCCYSSALIYLRTSSDYWAITINRLRGNCRWYTCAQQKHLIRYASACDELGKRVQIHLTISRDSQSSPFIQSNSLSLSHSPSASFKSWLVVNGEEGGIINCRGDHEDWSTSRIHLKSNPHEGKPRTGLQNGKHNSNRQM